MRHVGQSVRVEARRRVRRSAVMCALVAFGVLAVPGLTGVAAAAIFNVTGTADNTSSCSGTSCPSLRAAVIASNNTGGPNTINVPAGHYTLTLTPTGGDDQTTGDLNVFTNVTIKGAGAGTTTITGKNDRVFDISAKTVTLSGLTMTGGTGQNSGGAVRDDADSASLTLNNDVFTGNTTTSNGFGGAVDIEMTGTGALTVTNSAFHSNVAAATGFGGGGFGGAINVETELTATVTIVNTEFDSNIAQTGTTSGGGFGGAINFEPGDAGTLNVTASTFNGNAAQGSSSQGGFGGAIMFEPGNTPSALNITNSTFTANSAGGASPFGGAIMFQPSSGTASQGTLTHVTMVGNSTTAAGRGAGIYIQDAPITIRNSIISGNKSAGTTDNCLIDPSGGLTRQGHNIEQGTTCGFDINANPLVSPLANNGGATQTMAIAANSPARDAAAVSFCPATDQRGNTRPDDAGTPCDIGAFEFGLGQTPNPPNTKITRDKISKGSAKFTFIGMGTVTGFQCALVKVKKGHKPPKPSFKSCASPKAYKNLKPGQYMFEVRALNSAGPDPTPATRKFKIKKRK